MVNSLLSTVAHPQFEKTISIPDASIIVPTYCEAANLVDLVVQIHAATSRDKLNTEILIVDDDSPDQTSDICRRLAETYPVQLVVRRGERGLSSAVIHGLRIARGRVLVVMDGDLSHPPETIPDLISAITRDGVEFAVASRYMTGGGIDQRWGPSRRILSGAATWLARPLVSISDPMSGFFALPRVKFDSIVNELNPVGYKIGLEILVKLHSEKVAEIPIIFRQRVRGSSKLSFGELARFLLHISRLYVYRLKRSELLRRL